MNVQRQIDQLIAYQAAEWFETIRCGDTQHHADFIQWLSESPRHMDAFLSIASESQMLRTAFAAGSFDLGNLLAKVSTQVSPLPTVRLQQPAAKKPRHFVRRRPLLSAAIAAALTIGVAVTIQLNISPWQSFETPIGEQRAFQLADGSIVTLNANSLTKVRFDATRRDIRLFHGEAIFTVAQDRTRPFRVHTKNAVVQAVGTQFNVYARPDGTTTVSVLEGKVRVSADTDLAHKSVFGLRTGSAKTAVVPTSLAAGEEAKVAAAGNIEHSAHPNVADSVAWQQRKLIFKRTALEDIATEFNRYNKNLQIRLEDIEPGTLRFTGAFNADDPLSLAALLAREADLSVQKHDEEIVVRHK